MMRDMAARTDRTELLLLRHADAGVPETWTRPDAERPLSPKGHRQAARASDRTAFLTMGDDRAGYVVEHGPTMGIFTNPRNQLTEDYVSGRFG